MYIYLSSIDLAPKIRDRRKLLLIFCIIGLINSFSIANYLVKGKDVLLVPTNISSISMIGEGEVTESYLQDISKVIIDQYFNTTPENISQNRVILRSMSSSNFTKLFQRIFSLQEKSAKETNEASRFNLNSITVDTKEKNALVKGIRTINLDNKLERRDEVAIRLSYKFEDKRIFLDDIDIKIINSSGLHNLKE